MYYYNVLTLDSTYFSRILGKKRYELTNHLGNVMAVISDKKNPVSSGDPFTVDYYLPDIKSAQDFFPFGSVMPKRNFSLSSYRFAFNGMERDDEVKGSGNSYDFGERMYDPRIGRWLSVDMLAEKYPFLSPYVYGLNNPLIFIDPNGYQVEYIINKALEELGFKAGIEIWTDENSGEAIAIKNELVVHSGAKSDKASFSLIQTSYSLNKKGEVTGVQTTVTTFTVTQNPEQASKGEVSVSKGIDVPLKVTSEGKHIHLIDGGPYPDKFAYNKEDANEFIKNEPVIKAFGELIKNNSDLVKAGKTSFSDPFTASNLTEEGVKLAIQGIQEIFIDDPISGKLLDEAKKGSRFEKALNSISKLNRVFVPEGKEQEAVNSFKNDQNRGSSYAH